MKIRNRFLTKVLAWLAFQLLRLLYATCRKVVYAEVPGINAIYEIDNERFLYSVWHDQIVMTLFFDRAKKMAGLVGPHRDGGYVAELMKLRRMPAVRGSSSRGGAQAVREMMEVAEDYHIAITPDGPRGPRHEAKPGLVYLASQTGRRIVAAAFTGNRLWRIRGSWTDMIIPKPFSKLYLVILKPISVPADLPRSDRKEFVETLNSEMQRAADLAERMTNGEKLDSAEESIPLKQSANAA